MIMFHDERNKTIAGRLDGKHAQPPGDIRARGAAGVYARIIAAVLFAAVSMLAFAASLPNLSAARENPRFANLQIDIWPEFDRRGAALIILKGELPAEVVLPADISLRIPAASGGPSAVAFAAAAGSEMFNLAYDRTDGDDFITVRFRAPQRFIHVEFYDRLVTDDPGRSYTYVWPGDVAVDRLSTRLQEPASASGVSVQPDLGEGIKGPDGLLYRTAELGARESGSELPVDIRYTKPDPQTSTEILGVNVPDPNTVTASFGERLPAWGFGLATAVGLSVAGVAFALSWRRRKKMSGTAQGDANFCSLCGNRLAGNARFCSSCGAPVRKN
jgi:hypothetical protein